MKSIILKILEVIIPNLISKLYVSRKKKNNRKIIDLNNHDVFSTLNRVRNEVSNMKFYTHGNYDRVKSRMCFDFTKHKTFVCASRMKNLLNTRNIDNMNKDKLKLFVLDEQRLMHEEYINSIIKEWKLKGIQSEDIDYIVRLFEKFRYDVVVSFEHRINSIFGNSYNDTNFSLILAVFEMWAMGIDLLPRDMQTTFESLNGKFKNLKYIG
jgi:hypothetical protein